jgi:tRNA (guanine-N7-)-methyltransferase
MLFRLRSFVRRGGRGTPAQARAQTIGGPKFGLRMDSGPLDINHIFGREAPCFLEIGFGSGHSLLELAKNHPDKNFIGIETHKPGIGALLMGMENEQLTNIRIYDADAIDVLEKCIPNESLAGVQLFFPDPWPKRRHHHRRLIQTDFIRRIHTKLKPGGSLHLATDWEDYAQHMLQVLSAETSFINLASLNGFSTRSPYRPILTKFERRALNEGRQIRDLQFQKG